MTCRRSPTSAREIEGELDGDGRLLLRYSGTENLARVMIEGKDQTSIEAQARRLADVIAAATQLNDPQSRSTPQGLHRATTSRSAAVLCHGREWCTSVALARTLRRAFVVSNPTVSGLYGDAVDVVARCSGFDVSTLP